MWMIGFISGICILLASMFTFTLIIQHLHCIPVHPSTMHSKMEPENISTYSTLSSCFATLCVILILSTYPVCTQWFCSYNLLGNAYNILVLDTYVLAKLFLYLIFIGRLFNPYYRRIYHYSQHIQYLLWTVLLIVVFTTTVWNIGSVLNFKDDALNEILTICSGVYVFADCLLSISTMILFFRPICRRHRVKQDAVSSNGIRSIMTSGQSAVSSPSTASRSAWSMSVVMKYGVISTLQMIASTVYGLSWMIRIFKGWYHVKGSRGDSYLDICSVIQMLDCLILMICIYLGFARKQTYQAFCETCELFCIRCCCSCCSGYDLELYIESDLWKRECMKKKLLETDESELNGTFGNTTLQIYSSSVPAQQTLRV